MGRGSGKNANSRPYPKTLIGREQAIIDRYTSGCSIATVAKEAGSAKQSIRDLLNFFGIERHRTGYPDWIPCKWTPEKVLAEAALCVDYADFRVNHSSAYQYAKRLGVLKECKEMLKMKTIHKTVTVPNTPEAILELEHLVAELCLKHTQGRYKSKAKQNRTEDVDRAVWVRQQCDGVDLTKADSIQKLIVKGLSKTEVAQAMDIDVSIVRQYLSD